MEYRVSVFFNDGNWMTVKTAYAYDESIAESLNADDDKFVNICGVICKPKDVSKVIIEPMEEVI